MKDGSLASARRLVPEAKMAELGDDRRKIAEYLISIRPYVRGVGWYELEVDEDAREIGIANDDIALLDRCVELLGTKAGERARRVLERYTGQSFALSNGWRKWLRDNRERLFFSDAGGYRWYVDTRPVATRSAR